jgi:hypothetical protein
MHSCVEDFSLQINSFLKFSVVFVVKIYVLGSGKFHFHVIAKFADIVLCVFDVVNVFFADINWKGLNHLVVI